MVSSMIDPIAEVVSTPYGHAAVCNLCSFDRTYPSLDIAIEAVDQHQEDSHGI